MPKPKIISKNFLLRISLILTLAMVVLIFSSSLALAMTDPGPSGSGSSSGTKSTSSSSGFPTKPTEISTGSADSTCRDTLKSDNKTVDDSKVQTCVKNDPIITKVNQIVDVLSAAVGIVVVAVIIAGGIQYSLAGGSSEAVTKAKDRMMNGFIALIVYLFAFAILQWLIPGGLGP